MIAVKQWIGLAIVAVVLVWPGVHAGLQRRYGIDPWKLCGFAMYSRPHPANSLQVLQVQDGEARPVRIVSPRLEALAGRIGRLRGALGDLQSLDPLGEAILEERPDLGQVRLVVRRIEFDCRSASFDRITTETLDYPPGPPDGAGPASGVSR